MSARPSCRRRGFPLSCPVSIILPFRASPPFRSTTILTISEYPATKPIVSALSAWIALAWAIIFLGGTSELLVFSEYGFNYGEAGSIQL